MENKATDKEIIEVLQGIKDDFRIRFPRIIFGEDGFPKWDFSAEITIPDIAGVLARQQAENSNLTSNLTSLQNDLTSAKAEVGQWKEEVNGWQTLWAKAEEDIQTAKTEAVKEFAERLKGEMLGKYCVHFNFEITNAIIDNLVKEMVGEE